ncbi:uncharacterized protein LOC6559070 [Drosophila grimshawi]|uniref:GH21115 n=1 Tax=Drosophila grimshawi TaxID=7222 RepID=B4J608_DROGR|nr:uncharacterized protein LOC6559070 [Drosophila grimshawi]EDW00851.1 GH21115 [Drosophila grimshawi]
MTSEDNFAHEFERYLYRSFHFGPNTKIRQYDPSIMEIFGVLSLTDVRQPDRKLWYVYYCKQTEVDETLDRIFKKYGKKNMREIFRKPVFSGVDLCDKVKDHFAEKKLYVKGKLIEAPRNSPYNDDKIMRQVTGLYDEEQRLLFQYVCSKS